MRKRQKFTSINKVVEVSDEEYRRLAAEASAKMRVEAKKRAPRSERNKAPVEASLVTDEEYQQLAQSARVPKPAGTRLARKSRAAGKIQDPSAGDVSPEEYRRLAVEMMNRDEERGRRRDKFIGFLRGLVHPITIAIVVLGGICLYFLVMHKHVNAF